MDNQQNMQKNDMQSTEQVVLKNDKSQNSFVEFVELMKNTGSSLFHSKRFIFGLVIIVFAFVLFLNSLVSKNKIHSADIEANQAVRVGNYDKAITIYSSALKKNKNNVGLLTGLIQSSAQKGNATGEEKKALEVARPYIEQALKQGSENPQVLKSIGYAYETAGNYHEALSYYDKVIKLTPDSADAWFHHGHVLEFLGKTTDAYSEYEKAYSLDKNNPQILMARGNMFVSQGKFQESFESFKQASEVPDISNAAKAEALTGASIVRSSQDSFKYIKEALALSGDAVASDPNFSPALAAHGYNLYLTDPTLAQGIVDGISYVKKAVVANPRIAKNYYMLGLFYRGSKDYTNAIAYFQEAVAKVDQDNTLLSNQYKKQAKALYIYNLARTYSIAAVSYDTLSLLKQSFDLDPSLKSQVKKDIVLGTYFKELKNNQELINLINN